ncbi:MAG TPA: helix-turn-helix domain-containing protein [Bacteroidales bacterium]|nr:helix-turn-helix domain-containing protein [Bacteroidales bacterium]
MTRAEKESLKFRILRLAALKGTGSPAELALRFEISERSVKRIVSEIREQGNVIRYCPLRRSYVTEEEYR